MINLKPSENALRLRKILEEQENTPIVQPSSKSSSPIMESEMQSELNSIAFKRENSRKVYKEFVANVKASLLESCLSTIYNKSLGNTALIISEDTKNFNKSLIVNYIKEAGVNNILNKMETASMFLSEMALEINERTNKILENVDPEDPATCHVDSEEELHFFDNIQGDEDVNDITDLIKMRVSRATEDFMEKNIADKYDIKDIMLTAKEKIENINTGNTETDEQIAHEQTIFMKRAIKEKAKRPHNVYEQMVINLTEAIIADDKLKDRFVKENGKLNMDTIVEKVNSIYTLHEMLTSLRLEKLDEAYIEKILDIK